MAKKFIVAQPGYDARTVDDEHKAFDSDWDSLKAKTVAATSVTVPNTGSSIDLDIPHDLGYAPAFFALVKLTTNQYCALPFFNLIGDLDARISEIRIFSDTAKIRIIVYYSAGGSPIQVDFKYFLFYNQLD